METLFARWQEGYIYTWLADVLLAVNPFSEKCKYDEDVSVLWYVCVVRMVYVVSVGYVVLQFTNGGDVLWYVYVVGKVYVVNLVYVALQCMAKK